MSQGNLSATATKEPSLAEIKFTKEWSEMIRIDYTSGEWKDEFEHRCEVNSVSDIDINDLRHLILTLLPRRIYLHLNGNSGDDGVAPFLCVN